MVGAGGGAWKWGVSSLFPPLLWPPPSQSREPSLASGVPHWSRLPVLPALLVCISPSQGGLPAPQHCIWAACMPYTTACGNVGSFNPLSEAREQNNNSFLNSLVHVSISYLMRDGCAISPKYFNRSFHEHSIFFSLGPTYESSQARGWIRTAAASRCHSHSNTASEPHVCPTPQLVAMLDPLTHRVRPGIKPPFSRILVGFVTCGNSSMSTMFNQMSKSNGKISGILINLGREELRARWQFWLLNNIFPFIKSCMCSMRNMWETQKGKRKIKNSSIISPVKNDTGNAHTHNMYTFNQNSRLCVFFVITSFHVSIPYFSKW